MKNFNSLLYVSTLYIVLGIEASITFNPITCLKGVVNSTTYSDGFG